MKVFISQPMTGLNEKEILSTREKEETKARLMFGVDVEFASSYIYEDTRKRLEEKYKNDNTNWGIYWLTRALSSMCTCDTLWLVEGWQNSKGCQIEREVAEMYGLDVYYPANNYKELEDV